MQEELGALLENLRIVSTLSSFIHLFIHSFKVNRYLGSGSLETEPEMTMFVEVILEGELSGETCREVKQSGLGQRKEVVFAEV